MSPVRILVVDDSAVIRRVLCESLAHDPGIEVVGTAANGRIALSKIPQLRPDLVTLDVEMPEMNGLETLVALRKSHPNLPVIMFSTLTEKGAETTLEALALGASDYFTKPSNTGSLETSRRQIQEQLIPKVKALCPEPRSASSPAPATRTFPPPAVLSPHPTGRVDVLAIGTSTGGPNALAELMPGIPANFPVPIVIVQHMPAVFTRLLAGRLNDKSAVTVREGQTGQQLNPGEAWIAPGGYHMVVERHGSAVHLATNQEPPENSCRPAVDPLFRSVAKVYGPNVLAVVLTGMGYDGVGGSRYVRESGGHVLVQDEKTSVVWGMPGQVAAAGLASAVFPLKSLAGEIVRRAGEQRGNEAPMSREIQAGRRGRLESQQG